MGELFSPLDEAALFAALAASFLAPGESGLCLAYEGDLFFDASDLLSPDVEDEDEVFYDCPQGHCYMCLFPEHPDFFGMAASLPPVMPFYDVMALGQRLYSGSRLDQFYDDLVSLLVLHDPASLDQTWGLHSAFDSAASHYINPNNQQTLESYWFDTMNPARQRIMKLSPFSFSSHPASKDFMRSNGLPFSDMLPDACNHPLHAHLRRRQLYEVLPGYIKGPVTLVCFGDANAELFKEGLQHPYPVTVLNVLLDMKDLSRYNPDTLSKAIFNLDAITTPYVIFLDNGHFFEPANILGFWERNPLVRFMLLTHVYPLAALTGNRSPQPLLYTFAFEGEDMIYVPEGHTGGAYRQPKRNPALLGCLFEDINKSLRLNASVVDTMLNSHVQVITPYELSGLRGVALSAHTFMDIPRIFNPQPETAPIPVLYFQRLIDYGRTVAVKPKDLFGKLRQQANSDEFSLNIAEKDILVAVVHELLRTFALPDLPSRQYTTFWGKVNYKTLKGFNRWFVRHFRMPYYERMRDIVSEPNDCVFIPALKFFVEAKPGKISTLKWELDPELQPTWKQKFKSWFKRSWMTLDQQKALEAGWLNEKNEIVEWDEFLPFNHRWVSRIGAEKVLEAQAADYWRMRARAAAIETTDENLPVPEEALPPVIVPVVDVIPPQSMQEIDEAAHAQAVAREKMERVVPEQPAAPQTFDDAYRDLLSPTSGTQSEIEELKERWKKIKATGLVKPLGFASGVSARQRWDQVFPKTSGDRVKEAPYSFNMVPRDLEYPTNDCILTAVGEAIRRSPLEVLVGAWRAWPKDASKSGDNVAGIPIKTLHAIGCAYGARIVVAGLPPDAESTFGVKSQKIVISLLADGNHITLANVRARGIVINDVKNAKYTKQGRSLVKALSALPTVQWTPWTPGKNRAEAFVREMIAGTTGTLHTLGINTEALRAMEDGCCILEQPKKLERSFAVIEGDPGCRKSSAVQGVLRRMGFHSGNAFRVVTQTGELCDDWKTKIDAQKTVPGTSKGLPDYFCCTYEKGIAYGQTPAVIIGDEDKFPPGYFELLALRNPGTKYFIWLGDRFQAKWHPSNDQCMLKDLISEGTFFSAFAQQYLVGTWRFSPEWANFFRMPSYGNAHTKVFIHHSVPTSPVSLQQFFPKKTIAECTAMHEAALVLYPSDAQVKAVANVQDTDVVSHSGSQGRGEDLVYVVIDEVVLRVEDCATLYAALTRVKKWMIIAITFAQTPQNLAVAAAHPIISKLIRLQGSVSQYSPIQVRSKKDTIDIKEMQGGFKQPVKFVAAGPPEKLRNREFLEGIGVMIPAEFIDPDVETAGYRVLKRDDPSANAQFNVYVDELDFEKVPERPIPEMRMPGEKLKTALPVASRSEWIENQVCKIETRERRELRWRDQYSEQFPDWYPLRHDQDRIVKAYARSELKLKGKVDLALVRKALDKLADADRPDKFNPALMNYGQLQSPNDDVTFWKAVHQRLRASTVLDNERIYAKDTGVYGPALFDALKRAMKWNQQSYPWDPVKFEECIARFSERRNDRPAHLKKASLNRSEPEYRQYIVMKKQLKMKDEEPPKGKPGQTLMIHADEYLFTHGPLGIYVLDWVLDHCPPHIYIHAKKSLIDFDDWCKKYVPKGGMKMESDGSHFETSVDHNADKMMELFFTMIGVPAYLIESYLSWKINAKSQLMVHYFMTLSGEIYTFIKNTLKKIAETHCRYLIGPEEPQGYGGDDDFHMRVYQANPLWEQVGRHDTGIIKIIKTEQPTAFSYLITPIGIMKEPVALLRKLIVAEQRGKLADVYSGYFLEFLTLYNKAEAALEYLNEAQTEALQLLSSEIFNIRRRAHVKLDLSTLSHVDQEYYRPVLPRSHRNQLAATVEEAVELKEFREEAYTASIPIYHSPPTTLQTFVPNLFSNDYAGSFSSFFDGNL